MSSNLHFYKEDFFEKTKIGIPGQDVECNDAVLFGCMVSRFIEEVRAVFYVRYTVG